MDIRPFGKLGTVSALAMGGGGLGQLWGPTSRKECVATAREASDLGITCFDMAPSYGEGEAESVIGEAFAGKPPEGTIVTTKYRIGEVPPNEIHRRFEESLTNSLKRMRLDHVDILFVHNWITKDGAPTYGRGTPRSVLEESVIPAMQKIIASGLSRAWGLTGIGDSAVIIDLLDHGTKPDFIQVVTNLLGSPGGLGYPNSPSQPTKILAAAQRAQVSVMGIRAVQAGALTSKIDRFKPTDDPESRDFERAEPFRQIAQQIGLSPAFLAHQYALSMDGPATIVLGVKNRVELQECVETESAGPMSAELMQQINDAIADAV